MQTKLRYKEFGSTLLECIPWTAPSTHSPLQSSALEREVSSTTWRRDRLYLCLSRGIGSLQRTVLETRLSRRCWQTSAVVPHSYFRDASLNIGTASDRL